MSENKGWRLGKVAKEFNVGLGTMIDFLAGKGVKVESNPNTKVDDATYEILAKEFASDKLLKEKSIKLGQEKTARETITIDQVSTREKEKEEIRDEVLIKNVAAVSAAPEKPKEKEKKDVPAPQQEAPAPPKAAVPEPVVTAPEPTPEPAPVVSPEAVSAPVESSSEPADKPSEPGLKVLGKIDLNQYSRKKESPKKEQPKEKAPEPVTVTPEPEHEPVAEITPAPVAEIPATPEPASDTEAPAESKEPELIRAKAEKLEGFKIMGKIDLPVATARKKPEDNSADKKKEKRKRIKQGKVDISSPKVFTPGQSQTPGQPRPQGGGQGGGQNFRKDNRRPQKVEKAELTDDEIQKQIKETLARLGERGKSKAVKFRKEKRDEVRAKIEEEMARAEEDKKTLRVTEFVSANELAKLMEIQVNSIISACLSLGLFVSINQRLDAETISIIAEEFGYKVEFVAADIQEAIREEADKPEDLSFRPPVVTVMGHVDHGKTSLLDYVRKANVIAGEAGGITQHIGAYGVELEDGRKITFIDTPGHEAFTAMRARGAKVTDVAIIVIAADDSVMPQTIEAINHAQAAGVPMVFAFNKIDKPGANPDKIREALAGMNILVEDWGGKYQCQEISAKSGKGVDHLLEKVLLEAEMLELKANPEKNASGTVIEAQLDKGRGFVCTVLVQNGTLRIGDVLLAGPYSGRVKAMFNERGIKADEAGPAIPVRVLGLNGAPQAGDNFNVLSDEREAREIATKRLQLQREQGLRTRKHITLDEIGRRIAIGDFQQLNIIVKGDTDGSVEALSDSLLKLSTESIHVNIIHKSVGQISESDVLLASASDAIVIGFQVRPSLNAKKLAEKEEIDIRHYSVIYKAIEEVKTAMEGMLSPDIQERITANVEVRDVFKITKVGTVAGCYVLDGKIARSNKIRIIRAGIVIHTGELDSLKRFKDDVKEVASNYECGMSIKNFNDIEVGDIIESYEEVEVARKL
jgi:translation initiation factor IF-2